MKRLVLLIATTIILSCSTEENKTVIVDKEVEKFKISALIPFTPVAK